MKGNINIRNGFEWFRYSFDPLSAGGRPGDIQQIVYNACDIGEIYRLAPSNQTIFENNITNSFNVNDESITLSFFPNPVVNVFNIEIENINLTNTSNCIFKFYDALGRDLTSQFDISSTDYDRQQLSVKINIPSELSKGMYSCVIADENSYLCNFTFSK